MKRLRTFNENVSFEETIMRFKEDPESVKTGEHYTTPDGSVIDAIYKDDHMVLGLIIDSPLKSSIGLTNIFLWEELKKV